jgi:uncharacterized membrane protein YphA (DoxX/SURF4 family)
MSRIGSIIRAASKALVKPTDAAALGTFRVLFGALMVWEVYRYHSNNRISYYYIEPNFYFTYELFPFVTPVPGQWMYLVFFVMGLAALGIALGFFYRVSALIFFLTYTYVFLLDKAQYNNHYYLIILLAFLLVIVDAHRWASIDQKLRPGLRSQYVPYWHSFILLAQVVIVYFYAGIAKINIDWLASRPMGDWLERRSDYPVVGPYFETAGAAYFFSYGGLIFDLTIGFLLIWPRTRLPAFLALLFFHLTNKWLFSIGIFPYLMIAATLLFVSPDWPRRVLGRAKITLPEAATSRFAGHRYWAFGFVVVYLALQVLIPLRHWIYPSYVAWSEEGHRFSWRMKLRSKSARVAFFVTDPKTNERWEADPRVDLTSRQASKMATRPDMIIQYVHHLKQKAEQYGIKNPVIQVSSQVSLNGRPYQPIVDPAINLAEAPLSIFAPSPWILPLEVSHLDQDNAANRGP